MGRKGPGYISPTVQREAIARWAEYRGVEIAAWHVERTSLAAPRIGLVCERL